MPSRITFPLLLFILLIIPALIVRTHIREWSPMSKYAKHMTQHVQQQQKVIEEILGNDALVSSLLFDDQEKQRRTYEPISNEIERIRQLPFSLFIFQADSLVFWSGSDPLPDKKRPRYESPKLIRTAQGQRIEIGYPLALRDASFKAICAIPLKYSYTLSSTNLKTAFATKKYIPVQLELTQTSSAYPIRMIGGEVVCYLQAGTVTDKYLYYASVLLLLLSFLFLAIAISQYARFLQKKVSAWAGAGFFLLSVIVIRFLTIILGADDSFVEMPVLNIPLDIPFNRSLGDFLINLVLLLWMLFTLLNRSNPMAVARQPFWQRVTYALGTYMICIVWMLFTFGAIKLLVMNTSINFITDSVFDFSISALLVIASIVLLMAALFVFTYNHVSNACKTGLPKGIRVLLIVFATGIASLLYPLLAPYLLIPIWLLAAFSICFFVMFDYFIDWQRPSLLWLIFWISILSAIPAFLLFHYNKQIFHHNQLRIAEALTDPRDSLAEERMLSFIKAVEKDEALLSYLQTPKDSSSQSDLREERLEYHFSNDNYLFYNYALQSVEYLAESHTYINSFVEDSETRILSQLQYETLIDNNLHFAKDLYGRPLYVSRSYFGFGEQAAQIIILFKRKRRQRSRVYNELLLDMPYKQTPLLREYEFVLLNNRQDIIDSEGDLDISAYRLMELPLEKMKLLDITDADNHIYAFKSKQTGVTAIWEAPPLLWDKFADYTSFFFLFFVGLITIVFPLNNYLQIVPNPIVELLTEKRSLRRNIQISIALMTVSFFIIIGIVTISFFSNSSTQYHNLRMVRKMASVAADAQHELYLMEADEDTPPEEFEDIIKPISEIHRMDINLYDLQGNLIRSSEEDFFAKGLQNRQMNPSAYFALHYSGAPNHNSVEQISDVTYRVSYAPLKLEQIGGRGTTIAYLGLPYYPNQGSLRSNVNAFMKKLLHVYVVCLCLSMLIAVLVSRSITRGLTIISDAMRRFRLNQPNEQIPIKRDDELGELVKVYNATVAELENSAQKLARSEREIAWREMAKQVAHEIKNPLTPMKLRIQHLLHTYKSDPDRAGEMIENTTQTMIEQIDNLARIASEFSAFAQMPQPNSVRLEFNHLVESVYTLFQENEKGIVFELRLPEELIYISADPQLLLSVCNNLVKNATEAIPPDRQGLIRIILSQQGDLAVLEVQDNGKGVPQELQDKIFQPNFTTKGSGTGLGLSICRQIVQTLDGRIYFSTRTNIGTSFFVELPVME